jgi:hypothetical protein
MDAWRFDRAQELLRQADAALTGWRSLEAAAEARGLTLPAAVRTAFEGEGGPAAALDEIAAEQAAIEQIATSDEIAARPRGPFETVGLIGERPVTELAAARDALASGDAVGAVSHAETAQSIWLGADDLGRRRVAAAVFAVLIVAGTLVVVLGAAVRRRRERRARERQPLFLQATPMGDRLPPAAAPVPRSTGGVDAARGYGTLASEPTAEEPSPRSPDEATAETGDGTT